MKKEELSVVLHKLSLLAISEITNRTIDEVEFNENLLSYGRCRVITEPVQFISVKPSMSDDEGHRITFQLSPNYLTQHYNLCIKGVLPELRWKITLGQKSLGVVDSLANSQIEFDFISAEIEQIDTEEFLETIRNLN
ncbi:hypothetical protein C2751_00035 [Polynucleobacter paneuropaeus]|uniref:hypothetical protein n=1 Tax=Polynucleobacter paneuropaeus TaxID=2527775 RepID=UPI001BFD696A|nr:hypothetical protein [Polynucleobacter paneuropaeus]MBT8634021.1 hypothetical protein [Polynucleobacter paneuropaeus]